MPRKMNAIRFGVVGCLVAAAIALPLALTGGASPQDRMSTAKLAGEPDAPATDADSPGEGPIGGYEAYLSAARTYPANTIPPAFVQNAKKTFDTSSYAGQTITLAFTGTEDSIDQTSFVIDDAALTP